MKTLKNISVGVLIAAAFMLIANDNPDGGQDFTYNFLGVALLLIVAVSSAKVRENIKSLLKSK